MAELFEKGRTTITEHLKNIFSEGELLENSVCRDFRHTAEDSKSYVSGFDREVQKLLGNEDRDK